MKLKIKTCALMMGVFLNHGVFADPQTITYKNSRGSILKLNFNKEKNLTGTFTTAVASKECQDVVGSTRPIIGYIDGTAITFSMNYPSCGSVVTVAGHINPKKDTINTIAIITHQATNMTKDVGSQFITHDTYSKKSD